MKTHCSANFPLQNKTKQYGKKKIHKILGAEEEKEQDEGLED